MINKSVIQRNWTIILYKTDIEHRETLSPLRSINPNINHFTSQTPLCILVMFVVSFFVCKWSNKDFVFISSPMSPVKSNSWLFLYIHTSVAFPELLPIDIENPYRSSKCTVSFFLSLFKVLLFSKQNKYHFTVICIGILFQSHMVICTEGLVCWNGHVGQVQEYQPCMYSAHPGK